jgi:hypothetical protein
MARDRAERAGISQARERVSANRVGGVALGERRKPLGVDNRPGRGQRVRARAPRDREQPVGGAVAGLGVGVPGGDAAERGGVVDPSHRGTPDAGIRVGLGEHGQFDRVLEFTKRVKANCGVRMLPTRLRFELSRNPIAGVTTT